MKISPVVRVQIPKRHVAMAIGSLVWSLVAGAALLVVLRFVQLAAGSGHAAKFPLELIYFSLGVDLLLMTVVLAVVKGWRWSAIALILLLLSVPLVTASAVIEKGWASDFLSIALAMEAVWLWPWGVTAWILCRSPAQPS